MEIAIHISRTCEDVRPPLGLDYMYWNGGLVDWIVFIFVSVVLSCYNNNHLVDVLYNI